MPKMKTNRGAAKRFRKTGRGKIRRNRAYRRHILTTKTAKQKRQLRRRDALVASVDLGLVRRLLPYL